MVRWVGKRAARSKPYRMILSYSGMSKSFCQDLLLEAGRRGSRTFLVRYSCSVSETTFLSLARPSNPGIASSSNSTLSPSRSIGGIKSEQSQYAMVRHRGRSFKLCLSIALPGPLASFRSEQPYARILRIRLAMFQIRLGP